MSAEINHTDIYVVSSPQSGFKPHHVSTFSMTGLIALNVWSKLNFNFAPAIRSNEIFAFHVSYVMSSFAQFSFKAGGKAKPVPFLSNCCLSILANKEF